MQNMNLHCAQEYWIITRGNEERWLQEAKLKKRRYEEWINFLIDISIMWIVEYYQQLKNRLHSSDRPY
jgi:hypothetical protein